MMLRWKLRELVSKYGKYGRPLLGLCVILVIIYVLFLFSVCTKLLIYDTLGWPRPKFFCISFTGRLANLMFQYAFAYSFSKERKLEFIISTDNVLTDYFKNIAPNTPETHGFSSYTCSCFWEHNDDFDCGYDDQFEKLPFKDVSVHGYFQSWKYWIKDENEIRRQFQFNTDINNIASEQLRSILKLNNVSVKDTTLVGLHVRKGDYTDPHFSNFGYQVAPSSYIVSAMRYYENRFSKVFFIVSSNDPTWTSEVLSTSTSKNKFYVVRGNTPPVDMALLSMTNHTIMTVGTYGWMVGWLTGGTVVHYKYPYVKGSPFSRQFHQNYSDHFYPGWIAM